MAEGRAQAEAAPDIDVSSDSGETYSGDVGGGRGSEDSSSTTSISTQPCESQNLLQNLPGEAQILYFAIGYTLWK